MTRASDSNQKYNVLMGFMGAPILLCAFFMLWDHGLLSALFNRQTSSLNAPVEIADAEYYYDKDDSSTPPIADLNTRTTVQPQNPALTSTSEPVEAPPHSQSIAVAPAATPTPVVSPVKPIVAEPKPEPIQVADSNPRVEPTTPVSTPKKETTRQEKKPATLSLKAKGSALATAPIPPTLASEPVTSFNAPPIVAYTPEPVKPSPTSVPAPSLSSDNSEDMQASAPTSKFSPSVLMVTSDKVWVKTSISKTSIFRKGEAVPGFGVFEGESGGGALFNGAIVHISK